MPRLQLFKLTCHKTEDITGADEAYITVNGSPVWGPISINDGQSATLSGVPEFSFSSTLSLQLWDQDTGFLDPDDLLGSLTVGSSLAGQGQKSAPFNGDGASYSLVYEVLADPTPPPPPPPPPGTSGPPDGKKPAFPQFDEASGARGNARLEIGADGIAVLSMKVDAPAGGSTTRYVAFGLITGYRDNQVNNILLEIEPRSLTVASSPFSAADKSKKWYFPLASADIDNVRHIRVFLERDKSEQDLATQIINTCRKAGEVWDAADSLYKKVSDSELGKAIVLAAI